MNYKADIILFAFCFVALLPAEAQCTNCTNDSVTTVHPEAGQYSTSTLVIWYDNSAKDNKRRLVRAVRKYKATIIYDYKNFNGIAIRIPDKANIAEATEYFRKVKGVLAVNRDRIMQLQD